MSVLETISIFCLVSYLIVMIPCCILEHLGLLPQSTMEWERELKESRERKSSRLRSNHEE